MLSITEALTRFQLFVRIEGVWGGSSVWLERFPVTEEVAGSSPVHPAKQAASIISAWKGVINAKI